jgi:hypothetical protein
MEHHVLLTNGNSGAEAMLDELGDCLADAACTRFEGKIRRSHNCSQLQLMWQCGRRVLRHI